MAIDRKLLEILCCPVTRLPVERLTPAKLEAVNREIRDGDIRFVDGSPVESELAEALVTENGGRLYVVEDGIPIMLEERSIDAIQFDAARPLRPTRPHAGAGA